MSDSHPSRFVVLRHDPGPASRRSDEPHFDWMFDGGESLRTWATCPIDRFDLEFDVQCDGLPDHRRDYLDYEGPVSDQRGNVTRVMTGHFDLIESTDRRFTAKLFPHGDQASAGAVVEFYRRLPERPLRLDESEAWRLRFSVGR